MKRKPRLAVLDGRHLQGNPGTKTKSHLNARCTIVPDPQFLELKGALLERLTSIASTITPQNFASLLDPLMRWVLEHGFSQAQAHEGTIWLTDAAEEHLVPAYNTGPHSDKLVGNFQQPIKEGIICMVMASEQPFVENDVAKNSQQSRRLDTMLGVETFALIAVPFYFLKSWLMKSRMSKTNTRYRV